MKNVKEKGWLYKIKLGLVFLTVSLTAFLVIYNVVLLNQKEEITGAGDRLTYYDDGYIFCGAVGYGIVVASYNSASAVVACNYGVSF